MAIHLIKSCKLYATNGKTMKLDLRNPDNLDAPCMVYRGSILALKNKIMDQFCNDNFIPMRCDFKFM